MALSDEDLKNNSPARDDAQQLSPQAKQLVERVRDSFTNGDLQPSEKLRHAILGRVIAQGDEETSDNTWPSTGLAGKKEISAG